MQHSDVTERMHINGSPFAMSNDQLDNGGEGCGRGQPQQQHHYRQHHHHNHTHQASHHLHHPNGSISPLPRSQSPPVLPDKHFAPQRQQSPLYAPHPQSRALSASQPGSPTLYRVSPITCETNNNNEMSVFNPQACYRSMAPSQSRFFGSDTLCSPNDPATRNMGYEVATSLSSSPPRYRRVITSPQPSASPHSMEVLQASQQSLHLPHAIATTATVAAAAAVASSAPAADPTQLTTATAAAPAETGTTAVPTNVNSPQTANSPSTGPQYRVGGSAAVAVPEMPAAAGAVGSVGSGARSPFAAQQQLQQQQRPSRGPLTGGVRGSTETASPAATTNTAAAAGAAVDESTIVPRKPAENTPLAVNGCHDRRATTATTPPQRPQARERASVSPPPPPHASVVGVAVASPHREAAPLTESTTITAAGSAAARGSESAGRWVSPLRPHRAGSADTSDGFHSPGSVPSSSCEVASANASAPPLQQTAVPVPARSPAMYGVIGLPFSRAEASGPASVSSGRSSNTGRAALTSPGTPFQASPLSSKAPAVVKPRPAGAPTDARRSSVEQTATRHADPISAAAPAPAAAAVAVAPTTAHPRSGSSEHASLYRRSIARSVASNGAAREDVPAAATAEAGTAAAAAAAGVSAAPVSGSLRTTPPPPPMALASPQPARANEPAGAEKAVVPSPEEGRQHVATLAPAAVVAARGAAAAAAPASDAACLVERRLVSGLVTGGVPAPPPLTADTVLPVVAQEEEEARHSSSITDATERSSSSSRRQGNTPSPTSSKSSMRTGAATPLSSGRTGRPPQMTSSSLNGSVARQRREVTKQQPSQQQLHQAPPQRSSPLSATYSGSGSNRVRLTRATAVSASSDLSAGGGGRSSSAGGGRRASVSSTSASSSKSTAPVLAGFSFVSSRAHLQRYIDEWRDRFEEDKAAYKEGGYLTVTPGKIVSGRYVLIQKLGWGQFSTVWLAYDTKHATMGRGATQAFVAVKVAKCRTSVQEATHYEVSLLRYIAARLPPHAAVTNIIDCFELQGEFGMHTCMAMPLCGPNLLSVIDRVKGQRGRRSADDVRLVKEVIISILISLHELSVLNVVHTDIKPENVLCCAVDSKIVASIEKFCSYNQARSHMISTETFREAMAQQTSEHLVCLADFGLSALLEPPGSASKWAELCPKVKPALLAPLLHCKKNFAATKPGVMDNVRGTLIQTREYRAPEVLLGLDFTCTTDVWSVGCMTFELITGNFLMDPKKKTRDARDMDVEHLAMIMQLIGPLPPEVTDIRVRNNDYYDALVSGGGQTPQSSSGGGGRLPPAYLHRFVDRDGNFIYAARYRAYPRRSLEMELEAFLGFREARLAANFILSCLYCYDPKNRPSAKKLLSHPWFKGVGSPTKDKSGYR